MLSALWNTARIAANGHWHELLMRLRSARGLVPIAILVIACATLVPADGAGYSILKLGRESVRMSADTALVPAAVILAVLLFPALALLLGSSRASDRRQGVHPLLECQSEPLGIALGRLSAGLALGLLIFLIALVALVTCVYLKYASMPGAQSIWLFCAIGLPSLLAACLLAIGLESVSPYNLLVRVFAVLAVWLWMLWSSTLGDVDVFGVRVLRSMLGGQPDQWVSFGYMRQAGAAQFDWQHLTADPSSALAHRFAIAASLLAVIGLLGLAGGSRFLAGPRSRWKLARPAPKQTRASAERPSALPRAKPAGLPFSVWQVSNRFVWKSKESAACLGICLACAFFPGSAPVAIMLAVAAVFLCVGRWTAHDERVADELERFEPALAHPFDHAVTSLALALPSVLALAPALIHMPATRAATCVLGLLAISAWMGVCYRVLRMPVLGLAGTGLAMYAVLVGGLPPALDFIGFRDASAATVVTSLTLYAGAMLVLCLASRGAIGERKGSARPRD